MLTPRHHYGGRVVVLEAPPRGDLHPAVMRAPNGACRACVVATSEAPLYRDAIDATESFTREVALRARVPLEAPFVWYVFARGGRWCASAERPPGDLSLSEVVSRMREAHAQVTPLAGAAALAALVKLGADIHRDPDARVVLTLSAATVTFDGVVELRPRCPCEPSPEGDGRLPDVFHLFASEQVRGELLTPRATMVGLAYVAYLLLAQRDPYGLPLGAASIDRLRAIVDGPRIPLGQLRPDVPPALALVIDEMLARSPADRPDSFATLLERTSGFVGPEGPAALANQLGRLFADERASAERAAKLLAHTSFASLLSCPAPLGHVTEVELPLPRRAPSDRPSSQAGPEKPTSPRDDPALMIWPGDGRAMRRVKGHLWADVAPVTGADYARFIEATGRNAPSDWPGGACPAAKRDRPVVWVSLEDARAYARWAGKRLPLNDDWRLAMDELGFSAHGGGQVWEWTASRHGNGHVVRGGRFRDQLAVAPTVHHRSWDDRPADDIGFRCVAEA